MDKSDSNDDRKRHTETGRQYHMEMKKVERGKRKKRESQTEMGPVAGEKDKIYVAILCAFSFIIESWEMALSSSLDHLFISLSLTRSTQFSCYLSSSPFLSWSSIYMGTHSVSNECENWQRGWGKWEKGASTRETLWGKQVKATIDIHKCSKSARNYATIMCEW